MGPLTPTDTSQTMRVAAVAPVRAVQAVPAGDSGENDRETGSVRISSRGNQTAARERQSRSTGDAEVDQQLASAGATAVRTLTYSFYDQGAPGGDAQTQQARSVADRQRVREALNYYASVANVQFVEVGAGGDVQYGVTPAPSASASSQQQARNRAETEVQAAKAQVAADDASADAAPDPSQEGATAQTDDLVGLNPNDPDGRGGQPLLA